jgi:pimeloyl-ACP methyl ester carboxylesterase
MQTALGHCNVDADPPTVAAGPVRHATFDSHQRGRSVGWTVALPPGNVGPDLPVALVLHGRGDDSRTAFDSLELHRFLAGYVVAGGHAFALVAVDGGTTYWHPRASGDDPLGMIVSELIPLLKSAGLRTDRVGVLGWSMGGYGALLLARESALGHLGGTTVVAACAESPALFPTYAASAPGAFDGAADYARWGALVRQPGVSAATVLRVSCGDTDAFTTETERYRAKVSPRPAGGISRGCHTHGYWRTQATAQITFLGKALGE